MSKQRVLVFKSADELAQAAAEKFVECAREALAQHGFFRVAAAGGNTPKRVYSLLSSDLFKERIEWSKVHIFFGDERCVPPNHPESNYRMVYETLTSQVPIPAENVHRIKGEVDPEHSASLYAAELKAFFSGASWPQFDLVMLGMGEDGHTASLFPWTAALKERTAWVAANWVEQLGVFRITLTESAINAAANVIVLVAGASKAERLAEVLNGPLEPERLPVQLIKPRQGPLVWMIDAAAAVRLE
ncbi:MAG: 6-phosphogluconolactonase [Acidobacteriota bacterium]